jgi:TolA-binding protein
LSRYKEADVRFSAFVEDYPTNTLAGEAWMMLGDIAGTRADLPAAVRNYRKVAAFDVNIEFYNYAMFRVGEMLNEIRDFQGMIGHFKEYISRNRDGSNIPMAIYWIGTSMRNLGEQRGALEFFRDAVEKYGVDRKALGIDLILEEWVGQSKSADKTVSEASWADLEVLQKKAEKNGQEALSLRLKRMLYFQPNISDEKKAKLLGELVREENIPNASSGVLEFILEEAQKRKDRALAEKVAEAIIKTFPETDCALQARMTLADFAIADENYKVAIKHLTLVKEVYASSPEAASALLMLGDLQVKMGKFKEADECYKSILAVREWKGPLWPAALYGRGECARGQRNFEQASAYYERIYIMYGKHLQWSAKAYLARAECLNRLSLYNKAAETLQEMIAQQDLKDLPEYKEAAKRLAEMPKQ